MGSILPSNTSLLEKLESLKKQLSPEASVDFHTSEAYKTTSQRWSDYKAPKPGAVVNVSSEKDIEATVIQLSHVFIFT
jgi:hypothetical protein